MGACNAASYISRQPERNRIVNIRFVNDHRYLSYRRLMTRGELFGMDFIFNTIPHSLVPFDFKTFMESDQKCITGVTDCETGSPLYFEKNELGKDYMTILQASSSLPFASKPVHYKGRTLLDGGMSDSIPIQKSMTDGNTRNILVLTRPKGYRKKRPAMRCLFPVRYPRYRGLCNALATRYIRYNKTMDFIDQMEQNGDVFVIRPPSALEVGRVERNQAKLYGTYDQGYSDAAGSFPELCTYLKSTSATNYEIL